MSSITGTVDGLTNPSYSYDANGNLTCTSSGSGCSGTVGRTVNMTSFNMAASMGQGSNSLNLTYDDQHQRIEQVNTVSGTATTRTVYINDAASGAMSERVTASGTTPTVWNSFTWNAAPWGGTTANALPTFTDYITIDGQVVAQRKVTYPLASAWGMQNWNAFTWGAPAGSLWGSNAGANPPRFKWGTDPWSGNVVAWNYFNLDHLGSVAVITDQGGNVLQRLSFDAWGKQRNANGTSAACGTITSTTTKGFTNQEEMPTQCLVNLNARLYDSSIGKFMAADTIVGNPFNGQSFNRYAYVLNNPLSGTDPTGNLCTVAGCAGGPEFNGLPGLPISYGTGGEKPDFTDPRNFYPSSIIPFNSVSNANQSAQFNSSGNSSDASKSLSAGSRFNYGVRVLTGQLSSASSYANGEGVWTAQNTGLFHTLYGNQPGWGMESSGLIPTAGLFGFDERLSRRVEDIAGEVSSKATKYAMLGAKGEFAAETYLLAKGYTIVGRQLFVQTPVGFRITDFLITGGNLGKSLSGVEVKVNSAERSALQIQKDAYIRDVGGEVRSAGSVFKGQTLKYDTAVLGVDLQ